MRFQEEINGLYVDAEYSDEGVEQIFLPLLHRLTALQKEKNRRILVFLAAPPGAGKSTLVRFLKYLSENTPDLTPVTAIGIDGFHMYRDHLSSHTVMRDGQELLLASIKGASVTYDLAHMEERLGRIAAGEDCGWPEYSRQIHDPVEDAVTVSGDIVLLEGNYLLLEEAGWKDLRKYADLTVRIDTDPEKVRERLIRRKMNNGISYEEAASYVERSDFYNIRACLEHSARADLNLFMTDDGVYELC